MEIEPISGIRKDSPAETAGFRKGDRIVKVNGQDDFDPMRLPGLCFASAGKPMTFEVERRRRRRPTQDGDADGDPRRHAAHGPKSAAAKTSPSTSRRSGSAIRSAPTSSRCGPIHRRPRRA